MKTDKYQPRFYREWVHDKDLHLMRIADKETDLQVLANKKIDRDFVKQRVQEYRFAVENYIAKDRRFLTSLKPLAVELNAASIIRALSEASRQANVGPMAAVAGAIAQFLGKDLLKQGYKDVIVENGGDIFLKTTKTRLVGIYAGRGKLWNKLKLKIKPSDTPLGICTSSGTIGHSLSFGLADSVVILSPDACLADAVATATANLVKTKQDMQKAVDFAKNIRGIAGVAVIFKNNLISWGKIKFSAT